MMIRILYYDGQFDMVKPRMLDVLLETNRVNSFKRNDGWVVVGQGPLRNKSRFTDYRGEDRRGG